MSVSTFLDFKDSNYNKRHIGLRPAIHHAVKEHCSNTLRYSRVSDKNRRYYDFFVDVEDATNCSILIDHVIDRSGATDYYYSLFKNWNKFSKKGNFVSLGNFEKALLVFYFFLYCNYETDDSGGKKLNNETGKWIKRRLFLENDIRNTRREEYEKNQRLALKGADSVQTVSELAISNTSTQKSWITFQNKTEEGVSIYWLDYQDQEQLYFVMRPLTEFTQLTFTSHSWMVRRAVDNQKICEVTVLNTNETVQITNDMITDPT